MNLCELDYYAILNVPRSAAKPEITLAYRKLAIRLCPLRDAKHHKDFVPLYDEDDLTHMSPLPLKKQWIFINIAYDVLGNDLLRSIYDRYGEAGLLEGIKLPNGYFPPYTYHGDHMKVYHSVFSTYSPYANVIDAITNPPPLHANANKGSCVRSKDRPIEKKITLELEEVYSGCAKIMNVWRQEFINDEQIVTEKRKKSLTVNIPPGTTAGTRFTFIEAGDQAPTKIPSDIVFIAEDKPHKIFKRHNFHDLIYVHEIDLCQALTGFRFIIHTLGKHKVKVSITEVIKPGCTRVVPGEGLPKCKQSDIVAEYKYQASKNLEYGDLIVEFKIKFPGNLTNPMKLMCREFFKKLQQLEEETKDDNQKVITTEPNNNEIICK